MKAHIHDLESDYYNMENNIYLTKEVGAVAYLDHQNCSVFDTLIFNSDLLYKSIS